VGVPSASAAVDGVHDPAAYNLFRVERQDSSWRCRWTVRGYGASTAGFAELRQQELP
jgi:hypothetical protein